MKNKLPIFYSAFALGVSLIFLPIKSYAQTQDDSVSVASEEDVKDKEPYALSPFGGINVIEEYSLQRPRVAKSFDHKKLFDHVFIEGGAGLNSLVQRNGGSYFTRLAPSFSGALGDWITPEHGWRVSLSAGYFINPDEKNTKVKYLSAGADYLMNLSAISKWEYPYAQRAELMGVAGFNVFRSQIAGEEESGFGLNLGLRGLYHLSSYTYAYIEPKATLYYNLQHTDLWYKFRPGLSLNAGLGFNSPRLPKSQFSNSDSSSDADYDEYEYDSDGHWFNDTYLTVLAGPAFVTNFHPSTWKDYAGARAKVAVGKWFSPYFGAQLSANAQINRDGIGNGKAKVYGVDAEGIWNLHNTFGGYNPQRVFSLGLLAGFGYNINMYGRNVKQQRYSWSAGGGFSANVRLGKGVDFTMEPRVDIYDARFFPHAYTAEGYDMTASLLMGFSFHQGLNTKSQCERNDDYSQESWYDDLFVQAGLGIQAPYTIEAVRHYDKAFRPLGFIGVGKWLGPISGVRAWLNAGNIRQDENFVSRSASYGVDYLLNLANLLHGYDAERKFILSGAVGLNLMNINTTNSNYLGAQFSLQGLYKLNKLYGIFIEPQVRIYDQNALSRANCFSNGSQIGSITIGLQANLKGYKPRYYDNEFESELNKCFVSVGAGLTAPIRTLKHTHGYGATGRIAFGKWYSPISAWRIGGWGYVNRTKGERYGVVNGSLDYIMDASAFAFGYNPDRIVSTRFLAGVDLGMDYFRDNVHLSPKAHVGAQLAIKLSEKIEIFGEPQYVYDFNCRFDERLLRASLQGIVGLNYSFGNSAGERNLSAPELRNFVYGSLDGVIVSGGSLKEIIDDTTTPSTIKYKSSRYKLSVGTTLGYGYWLNGLSAIRTGFSVSSTNDSDQTLYQLHLDYMANMITLLSGRNTEDDNFQLRGIVGITDAFLSGSSKTTSGLGVKLGAQAAWNISSRCEFFVEPMAQLMSHSLFKRHAVDAILNTKLGVAYKF